MQTTQKLARAQVFWQSANLFKFEAHCHTKGDHLDAQVQLG